MPPYQLHLAVSDDLEVFLRSYAAAREISISAAVRIILREAMKQDMEPRQR